MADEIADLVRYAGVHVPDYPLLVPWARPFELSTGALQFRSDESVYDLRHPLFAKTFSVIRPMLDGKCSAAEIANCEISGILPTTIIFLLKSLTGLGLLVGAGSIPSATPMERDQALFLTQFPCDPAIVMARISAARILVAGSGSIRNEICRKITAAGACALPSLELDTPVLGRLGRLDLVVYCSSSSAESDARYFNEIAIQRNLPVLYVQVFGQHALLGPLVIPGETSCLECKRTRVRCNGSAVGEDDYPESSAGQFDATAFPPFRTILAGHIAGEVHRILGRYAPPATLGQCLEISATSLSARRHHILRVPGCIACGKWQAEAQW
jgi:bacteriocin biosynthesis cyclodehydratase domain-containing protein